MVPKKKFKSLLYSPAEFKKRQAKALREFKAKQKKTLAYFKKGRKAEAYYHKHGKWPSWWGKKKR